MNVIKFMFNEHLAGFMTLDGAIASRHIQVKFALPYGGTGTSFLYYSVNKFFARLNNNLVNITDQIAVEHVDIMKAIIAEDAFKSNISELREAMPNYEEVMETIEFHAIGQIGKEMFECLTAMRAKKKKNLMARGELSLKSYELALEELIMDSEAKAARHLEAFATGEFNSLEAYLEQKKSIAAYKVAMDLNKLARMVKPEKSEEEAPSTLTKYSILWFGRYKGSFIGTVLSRDPEYLEWCCENIDGFAERLEEGLEEEIRDSAWDQLEDTY